MRSHPLFIYILIESTSNILVIFTMTESRSAIIYYGGFRSISGGAYMHASLLHDALQHIGLRHL